MQIVASDGGVDLDGQSDLTRPIDSIKRSLIGALHLAELVVELEHGTVERNGEPGESGIFEVLDRLPGKQRSGTRSQRSANASVAAVAYKIEDVCPFKRIAAGHHEYRRLQFGNV